MKPFKTFYVVLLLSAVLMACGSKHTGQISTAVQESTKSLAPSASASAGNLERPNPPSSQGVTATPTPTVIQKPIALPTSAPQPINLIDKPFFLQDDQSITVIFLVENPNEGHAVENSQYQLIVSDESGTVLKTDSGYIELLLPNQQLAVVSELSLEKGQKAGKVEAQLKTGTFQGSNVKAQLFQTDKVSYYSDPYFPKVTGILTNSAHRSFEDLGITAVLYDQDNHIIGGGYSYLNFVPADAQTGFSLSVQSSAEPAKTEIYATISGLTAYQADNSRNNAVTLLNSGYSVKDNSVSVGFNVKNNLSDQYIESTAYHVNVFDDHGNILGVDEGYLNMLFPGEQAGTAVAVELPEGKTVKNVDVQIDPGSSKNSFEVDTNPFSTENVTFNPGTYGSTVTGTLKNSYSQTISDVELNIIAYDADGKIIGGGMTSVDFVPADGQTGFEISVDFAQTPSRIDAYPGFTNITKIGEN